MSKTTKHQHFALHKPYGYLSQFVVNGKQKKRNKLLGELYDFPAGTMAIGRLDRNSEGLLLLTTDGKVSYDILSHNYEKEYYVQVDGSITEETIQQLKEGVEISLEGAMYKTMPCEAKLMEAPKRLPIENRTPRDARHGPMSWISITLREGKYRQVRKMTAAVGFPTLRLIRVRIGAIKLTLPRGAVHPLELLNEKPHFK